MTGSGLVRVGGVHTQLRGRCLEDQPAVAGVDVGHPEHVTQEGAGLIGVRGVDDRVRSGDRHHQPASRIVGWPLPRLRIGAGLQSE